MSTIDGKDDRFAITYCPFCILDTVGKHQFNCLLRNPMQNLTILPNTNINKAIYREDNNATITAIRN